MYQALYRKYRPDTFDSVYGQRHITVTLQNQVQSGRVSHAYLFTGTRGTGKTTCAKILARAVNCENPQNGNPCNQCPSCLGIIDGSIMDVLELDAASNTGVDNMRSILEETTYPPASVKKRVYIIDEVHMLSAGAFNALLKTLEEPPEYVLFILATTELHRVAATILSRCQRFDFKRAEVREIAANISHIADTESLQIAPKALELIAKLADGSFRDSLSLLERCLVGHEGASLDADAVTNALGISSFESLSAIADAIANADAAAALLTLDRIYMDGQDIRSSLERLAAYFRDVLLYQTAPSAAAALSSPGFDNDALQKDAKRFAPGHVMHIIAQLQKTVDGIQRASGGRLEAELVLIGLCTPALAAGDQSDLAGRIAILESRIAAGFTPATPTPTQPHATDTAKKPSLATSKIRSVDIEAPPSPEDDDAPPFPLDDTAAPSAENQPASTAPQSAPPAAARQEKTSPDLGELPAETKVALLKTLSGVLTRSVYTYLTLAKMYYANQTLTIAAGGEFAAALLDKIEVRNAIAEVASRLLGENCLVRIASGEKKKINEPNYSGFDQIIRDSRAVGIPIESK